MSTSQTIDRANNPEVPSSCPGSLDQIETWPQPPTRVLVVTDTGAAVASWTVWRLYCGLSGLVPRVRDTSSRRCRASVAPWSPTG